jgi:hypothetical protein
MVELAKQERLRERERLRQFFEGTSRGAGDAHRQGGSEEDELRQFGMSARLMS